MAGEAVRHVGAASLAPEALAGWCRPGGGIARPRTLGRGTVGRAMVSAAGPPGGAYQADVLRSSLDRAGPRVARSACDRWGEAPLAPLMAALAERTLASARAPPVALAGRLGEVQDGARVDAPPGTGRGARREACPGTGGTPPSRGIPSSPAAAGPRGATPAARAGA